MLVLMLLLLETGLLTRQPRYKADEGRGDETRAATGAGTEEGCS